MRAIVDVIATTCFQQVSQWQIQKYKYEECGHKWMWLPRRFAPRNGKRRLKGNRDCLPKNYELWTKNHIPAINTSSSGWDCHLLLTQQCWIFNSCGYKWIKYPVSLEPRFRACHVMTKRGKLHSLFCFFVINFSADFLNPTICIDSVVC